MKNREAYRSVILLFLATLLKVPLLQEEFEEINEGKSILLEALNGILNEVRDGGFSDLKTLNLVFQALTNLIADSQYKSKVLDETCLQ